MLFDEISKLRQNTFRESSVNARTSIQDSILDGAIIETEKVLEIAEGDNITYTFPVSRTYSNNKIENLVLRKNADNTFSGALMQYNFTKSELESYVKGTLTNFSNKIKTYTIKNLSISARTTVSVWEDCWEFVYEEHRCTAGGNHAYGSSCSAAPGSAQAAQPSTLVAAYNHCEEEGGGSTGGGSSPGGSTGSGPGSGVPVTGGSGGGGVISGTSPSNPYNTFIFTSFDDMFMLCAEGDTQCHANIDFNKNVQVFLYSLGIRTSELAAYTPNLNLIKSYFATNGFGSSEQEFLKERLQIVSNWFKLQDKSTPEKLLHKCKISNWVLNILMENDTTDIHNFFNRVNILDAYVDQNPNILLNIPCSQLPFWQDVATHQVPQNVINKIQNIKNQTSYYDNWELTDLEDGLGARVNMDLFPVKIKSLPNKPGTTQKYTAAEFFEFFRKNINLFAEKFSPIVDSYYGINDTALWNSTNPLGSLIHIDITGDDGTVVCSGVSSNAWVFTTVKAPLSWGYDGVHPVAGNRFFSYYTDPNDGSITIYTRGVDRVSHNYSDNSVILNYSIESLAFSGADNLWYNMQDKLSKHVKNNGGQAEIVNSVKYRPNYNKIKNYLKGNAPLSSLGCN